MNRVTGCLLGLAVGDAVGTTNEFSDNPPPLDDMVGGGPFRLHPGEWTDDTSMALCLADSLIECRGFDAEDQMRRYCGWWKRGQNSVLGYCFDIGNTTKAALQRYLSKGVVFAGSTDPKSAGNGSLMRLAPIPIFYADNEAEACEMAIESSRVTHAADDCVNACAHYTQVIVKALKGVPKAKLLWNGVVPEKLVDPSGYVIHSLDTAIHCFATTDNFRDGCLKAANFGGDADTNAAIYGMLAGAYYGESGIPPEWLTKLAWVDEIRAKAIQLREIGSSKNELPK